MVHIKDEGSTFDAPIDVVWQYLQSDMEHGQAHKSRRNVTSKELGPNAIELSFDQEVNGQWVRSTARLTMLPPVGFSVEPLDGPLSGSKFYNFYTPRGDKTEVTVVGEYTSKMIPATQLEQAVLANNEKVFREDSEGIREYRSKR